MRRLRLNDWQRIGIALSILWAIGGWLYVEAAARKAAYERETVYSDICTLNKERRSEWDVKPCLDQANRLYEATYSAASAWALPVALVPIPIVWLLVYIVVWTRRG
jgi:hypothetical protein